MRRTIITGLMLAAVMGGARGQEFPEYPKAEECGESLECLRAERMLRDQVAAVWDSYSERARQCALETMGRWHITRTYENLFHTLLSCDEKESREKTGDE